MGTELATTTHDLDADFRLAGRLVTSGLVPRGLAKPEAVLYVILAGRELGLPPVRALSSIHIIEGKPVMSAELMVALVKARRDVCVRFSLVESTAEQATYETLRAGDEKPTRLTWTMAQAQRAGLAGKDNWRRHPEAMLRARCAKALAQAVYPDLLLGAVTPDEAEEITEPVRVDPALVDPQRETAPVEHVDRATGEVTEVSDAQLPPALEAFYQRLSEVELPGDAGYLWLRSRAPIQALSAADREAAWKALCKRTEDVGKMKNAKVWLKKFVAEQDARNGAESHP